MKKKNWRTVCFYIIPLLLVVVLQATGLLSGVENSLSDAVYQSPSIANMNIYVIGIDEETLSTYGQFENWSRSKTAELINLMCENPQTKPAVIAVDIGFYSEKDEAADAALIEAVKKAGNVVLVSSATFGKVVSENGDSVSTQVVTLEQPFTELFEAALAVGHSNVELDEDGIARHALGTINFGGKRINSFAYEVYKAYAGQEPTVADYAKEGSKFYISYTGEPREYFGSGVEGSSFCRVLDGRYPVSAFTNSIVFIGAYASGMQDNYYTSIDKAQQMYGVEIHANILNQMIDGVYKEEISPLTSALVTLVLGILVILLFTFLDLKISLPLAVLIGAGYFFGAKLVYDNPGVLFPLFAPLLTLALLIVTHIIVRYFLVHREKKRIIANYGKYLSPEVAKTIADVGEDSLQLGGIKKDICVLFVDIRGFTTLSESLSPEKVVEMLNSYLEITTSAIFHNQGTVDKFIGDATMGVFNAPLDLDDYTYRCVCAGLEMAELAKGLDDKLSEELRGRVGFGVGINCGDAVVGNIGTSFRMEYTAIGDTVNTASRLEGQAKAGWVVISDAVYERIKDRIECEDLGKVKLKGKAEEVQIWRAMCVKS